MPGSTYILDASATFTSVVLMSSEVKTKFGTVDEPETTADGLKKYTLTCAVSTPPPAPGMKAASEVIALTCVSADGNDPAAGITIPAAVQLEGVKMGVSAVERRGDRTVGGKPYFSCQSVKSLVPAWSGRKSDAA